MTVGTADALPRYAPTSGAYEMRAVPSELRCSQIASAGRSGQAPTVLVEIHGDLDKTMVARMRESLFAAAASSPGRIVIDMADVSFLDTVGLRTLIAARRRCVAAGTSFALRRPSRPVRRLLSVTHLDNVFDVEHERRG